MGYFLVSDIIVELYGDVTMFLIRHKGPAIGMDRSKIITISQALSFP